MSCASESCWTTQKLKVKIMPILDAMWDPIAGKIVYRDCTTKQSASTATSENVENHSTTGTLDDNIKTKEPPSLQNTLELLAKNRRRSRSMKRNDKKPLSLEWRTTGTPDDPAPERTARRNDRIGPISPSKFHQSTKKDPLPAHQLEATIQILRKEQTYERRAFKEITCYKSFPLQEQAIQFCQSLQNEWDSSYRLHNVDDDFDHANGEDPVVASSSSSSASSASSTSTTPEPKRHLPAPHMSPNECTMMQQFRNQLTQTRAVPSKSLRPSHPTTGSAAVLGSALYCLEPRIFAIESKPTKPHFASGMEQKIGGSSNTGGRRRYVAAHVGRFMDTYWCKTEPEWRHAYELIPPHTPCRLYLDIECVDHPDLIHDCSSSTTSSSCVSERQNQLLQELYEELASELLDRYGNETFHCPTTNQNYQFRPLQRHDIVDLDSSTATKFSRHWIVHLPVVSVTDDDERSEVLFPDNAAVGTFIRQWVGRMAEQHATGQLEKVHERRMLQEYLFVHKNKKDDAKSTTNTIDQMSCLIDMGVYTKNRLFRLMGSMKYGKPIAAAFRIADTNEFPFLNQFGNESFYVPAMEQNKDKIDDHMKQVASLSTSTSLIKKSLSRTDWSTHADALAQTFVVPINVAKIDYPLLPRMAVPLDEIRSSRSLQQRSTGSATGKISSFEKSPYPMIDEYVQNHLASRGGTQGMVRAWSMEVDPTTLQPITLSYQMCRNRYCECIGREHKSNNIIWNFNMLSMECYQTCHDPDCRALNFRGQSIPLPTNVRDELHDALFEEDLARLDISDHPPCHDSIQPQQRSAVESQNSHDVDHDDESSFDEALAALNIDDLVPPVNNDLYVRIIGERDIFPAQLRCTTGTKNHKDPSDPNGTQRSLPANENECCASRTSALDTDNDDDDDDDDSYSDLYRLALEINAKKEIQR